MTSKLKKMLRNFLN